MNLTRRLFLRSLVCGSAALGAAPCLINLPAAGAKASRPFLLRRSTPEAQGVASRAISDYLDAIAQSKHEFHSLMILRHGQVIAEGWWAPYRRQAPQMLYSLSKSFTSTAVGFAVAERRLRVDDPVIRFFPTQLPASPGDNLPKLRIKDLLTMSVGHAQDSTGALWDHADWAQQFLAVPIPHEPGTKFLYNSGATYMLSAIVQRVTGMRLIEYLRPRLFEPLAIHGATWETCPEGVDTGGWGLKLTTEALAKFGQFYLQKGVWAGRQLLPSAWIAEATSFKIQQPASDLEQAKQTSDWHQGYAYQFWRCRHNAYRGDGAFGQYTIVLPEQDAVIAITSESPSMQGQMDLVWQHLLPAMGPAPLARDKQHARQLEQRLNSLALAPVAGATSLVSDGKPPGETYKLVENSLGITRASFEFARDKCIFALHDRDGAHPIACGMGTWIDSETTMPGTPPKLTRGPLGPVSKVAASAGWSRPQTLKMKWQFYESPHHDAVTCAFEGRKVRIEFLNSITSMAPGRKDSRPMLEGTAV